MIGKPLSLTEEQVALALSADNFVNVRKVYGGTAPDETRRALGMHREREEVDEKWFSSIVESLERARQELESAVSEKVSAG